MKEFFQALRVKAITSNSNPKLLTVSMYRCPVIDKLLNGRTGIGNGPVEISCVITEK